MIRKIARLIGSKSGLLAFFLFILFAPVSAQAQQSSIFGSDCVQAGGTMPCMAPVSVDPPFYIAENGTLFRGLGATDAAAEFEYQQSRSSIACASFDWSVTLSWQSFQLSSGGSYSQPSDFIWSVDIEALHENDIVRPIGGTCGSSAVSIGGGSDVTMYRYRIGHCLAGFQASGNLPHVGSLTYCYPISNAPPDPYKNLGCRNPQGNPCNAATGNKYQVEVDYRAPNYGGLEFVRHYNSALGLWDHSFTQHIVTQTSTADPGAGPLVTVVRPDGARINFVQLQNQAQYVALSPDSREHLSAQYDTNQNLTGSIFVTADVSQPIAYERILQRCKCGLDRGDDVFRGGNTIDRDWHCD